MSPFINKVLASEMDLSNCHFAIGRISLKMVCNMMSVLVIRSCIGMGLYCKKAPHVHREHVEPFIPG